MPLFHENSFGAKLVDYLNSLPSADDELVDDLKALQTAQKAVDGTDSDTTPAESSPQSRDEMWASTSDSSPSRDEMWASTARKSRSREGMSGDTSLRSPRPPVPFPVSSDSTPWPPERAGSIGLRILAWALVLLAAAIAIPTLISLSRSLVP